MRFVIGIRDTVQQKYRKPDLTYIIIIVTFAYNFWSNAPTPLNLPFLEDLFARSENTKHNLPTYHFTHRNFCSQR